MAYERILYRACNLAKYFRIVRPSDGYIWSTVTAAFAETVAWTDSDIPMLEIETDTGQYPVQLPSDFPKGRVDIIVYTNAAGVGGTPVVADVIDTGYTIGY